MKILNLMENTEGAAGCVPEHGLSFYIETEHHRVLMDLGPSDTTLRNAERLGVDLTLVDTVVLSHGHYDHGGGIPAFSAMNPFARIYVRKEAFGEYFAERGEGKAPDYIGLDPVVRDLSQLILVEGELTIDEELSLFGGMGDRNPRPLSNRNLKERTDSALVPDCFAHEQCLVVTEGEKRILFSGCAHSGILNILDRFRELYGGAPDIVVSGFHMMKKTGYTDEERQNIRETARKLKKYPTVFWTCHCTGLPAFEMMKKIMGDRLQYVHCGETVPAAMTLEKILEQTERRKQYMKWHRFFAWVTVIGFVGTMVTGYKRK